MKMKHANYARTRATKAKGGQTTLNSVGPDRATEFHKPIKTFFKMKVATIKQIKQGEFFKLQPTDSAPVWVRGYYCREDKTFEAYKYDDTNHEGFFKGTKRVFVDFEF